MDMKILRRVPKFRLMKRPEVFNLGFRAKKLIRVWYKNPLEDFELVRQLSDGSRGWICHRKNTCTLAILQETWSPSLLEATEPFAGLHPNIAGLYDAYFHEEKFFVISEYLELSLWELESTSNPLQEWEVATVLAEVESIVKLIERR